MKKALLFGNTMRSMHPHLRTLSTWISPHSWQQLCVDFLSAAILSPQWNVKWKYRRGARDRESGSPAPPSDFM